MLRGGWGGVCLRPCVPGVRFPHGNGDATDPVRRLHVAVLHRFLQLVVEPQHQRDQVDQRGRVPAHACSYSPRGRTDAGRKGILLALTSGSRAARWR